MPTDHDPNSPVPYHVLRSLKTTADGQPDLSPEELTVVHQAPSAAEGHIQVAIARARRQFERLEQSGIPVLPEDGDISPNWIDLDPAGKYSIIDMKFARREAEIRAALQTRTPEVQRYVQELLEAIHAPTNDSRNPYASNLYYAMLDVASHNRLCSRAAKLCKDDDGRVQLYLQSKDQETCGVVVECDKMFQGLEYAAGLRSGPVSAEVRTCYETLLHTQLDEQIIAQAQKIGPEVKSLEVEFRDPDNSVTQRVLAFPLTWRMGDEQLHALIEEEQKKINATFLQPYAVATIKRVLDPVYNGPEQASNGIIDRGGLIIVDGRTVREIIQEDYRRDSAPNQDFETYYREHLMRRTGELVASALVAGKRVEAFLPDARGSIPKEPVQLVKTGYEPSPLQPEKFNAWHRFFSKFGYYKEKVERKKEYDKAMAARERVQAGNRAARLKDLASRGSKLEAESLRKLFFSSVLEEKGLLDPRSNGNISHPLNWIRLDEHMNGHNVQGLFANYQRADDMAPCHAFLCVMAAQGYQYRDIMDPNKLQDQRREMAREFIQRGEANDQEWMGRMLYRGQKALFQQAQELTRGVDLRDEAQLMSVLPDLAGLSRAAHMSRTGGWAGPLPRECRLAYMQAAAADAGGNLIQANEETANMSSALERLSEFSNTVLDGMLVQRSLIDPEALDRLSVDDMKNLVAARALTGQLKEGNTLFEKLPDLHAYPGYGNTSFDAQAGELRARLRSPENRNRVQQMAASGALSQALVIEETAPPEQVQRDGSIEILGKGPDGQPALLNHPTRQTSLYHTFQVKLELPAPKLEQQAPQRQEPRRQPPQMGGLGL